MVGTVGALASLNHGASKAPSSWPSGSRVGRYAILRWRSSLFHAFYFVLTSPRKFSSGTTVSFMIFFFSITLMWWPSCWSRMPDIDVYQDRIVVAWKRDKNVHLFKLSDESLISP